MIEAAASSVKRKPGRPRGSLAPVLADLSALVTLEDFSFVRALINGVPDDVAYLTYYAYYHFDSHGDAVIPHGLSINAHARAITDRIMNGALQSGDDLIKFMAERLRSIQFDKRKRQVAVPAGSAVIKASKSLPTIEEWIDEASFDPDFYTEADLIAEYEKYLVEFKVANGIESKASGATADEERALLEAQLQAVNMLQSRLASLPTHKQSLSTWLATSISADLVAVGVTTLGELVEFIGQEGRHWRKSIKGFGPVRARRLLDWLQANAATLGEIDQSGERWEVAPPLRSRITPLMTSTASTTLVPSVGGPMVPQHRSGLPRMRQGLAPLELMLVPPHLDGAAGLYRGPALNHWGVHTDLQAIRVWLATYLAGDRIATFNAYRRELERFYLWCVNEARIPLSSVSLAHALGYQSFLGSIPAHYISNARVTREDHRWRPFRGQLDPKSRRYALAVVGQFFSAAHTNGYLAGNPFVSVKSAATANRDLDTSRSLNQADLSWLKQALRDHMAEVTLGDEAVGFDLRAALHRRLNLVFHVALSTGLRLSELSSTTISTIQPAMVNGIEDDRYWMLEVYGKGKKIRTVPISEELRQLVLEHHRDARLMLTEAKSSGERMGKFESRLPLVCALRSPVGYEENLVTDEVAMANDNLALSAAGLYRILKRFFTKCTKKQLYEIERRMQDVELKMAGARGMNDPSSLGPLAESKHRLRREYSVWAKRSSMTTHWLRHTFAQGVLRDNANDAGLKLAQQLLGHQSIATTQIYLKVDDTEKARAVFNHKPFG